MIGFYDKVKRRKPVFAMRPLISNTARQYGKDITFSAKLKTTGLRQIVVAASCYGILAPEGTGEFVRIKRNMKGAKSS
jgi:hypothetical protein